jgi:hypothetical protein
MSVPNDPQENPQPDVDVTVGRTPLVGDAPPSDGTDVDVTVAPTTGLGQVAKTLSRRLALEGSSVRRVHTDRFLHAGARPDVPGLGLHTASARAASFPGLQSEVETLGLGGGGVAASGAPPGGP